MVVTIVVLIVVAVIFAGISKAKRRMAFADGVRVGKAIAQSLPASSLTNWATKPDFGRVFTAELKTIAKRKRIPTTVVDVCLSNQTMAKAMNDFVQHRALEGDTLGTVAEQVFVGFEGFWRSLDYEGKKELNDLARKTSAS